MQTGFNDCLKRPFTGPWVEGCCHREGDWNGALWDPQLVPFQFGKEWWQGRWVCGAVGMRAWDVAGTRRVAVGALVTRSLWWSRGCCAPLLQIRKWQWVAGQKGDEGEIRMSTQEGRMCPQQAPQGWVWRPHPCSRVVWVRGMCAVKHTRCSVCTRCQLLCPLGDVHFQWSDAHDPLQHSWEASVLLHSDACLIGGSCMADAPDNDNSSTPWEWLHGLRRMSVRSSELSSPGVANQEVHFLSMRNIRAPGPSCGRLLGPGAKWKCYINCMPFMRGNGSPVPPAATGPSLNVSSPNKPCASFAGSGSLLGPLEHGAIPVEVSRSLGWQLLLGWGLFYSGHSEACSRSFCCLGYSVSLPKIDSFWLPFSVVCTEPSVPGMHSLSAQVTLKLLRFCFLNYSPTVTPPSDS